MVEEGADLRRHEFRLSMKRILERRVWPCGTTAVVLATFRWTVAEKVRALGGAVVNDIVARALMPIGGLADVAGPIVKGRRTALEIFIGTAVSGNSPLPDEPGVVTALPQHDRIGVGQVANGLLEIIHAMPTGVLTGEDRGAAHRTDGGGDKAVGETRAGCGESV